MRSQTFPSWVMPVVAVVALAPWGPTRAAARGQTPDDQTRQIIAEEFLKARPPSAKPAAKPRPRYRPADPAAKSAVAADSAALGLTVWRLRPARPAEEGARLLVQGSDPAGRGSDPGELTAERVDTGTPLSVGDRVRLTIESPRAGALYVVDREVYADGTMSEPYLIFPTTRTRDGDNSVRGGRLIDIPGQHDRPSYFTVKPSRPGQVGELLTILVSPAPIEKLTIGDKAVILPQALLASWEQSWGAPVQQFVQEGSKATWTRQEQTAAADRERLLTQEDPAPQTLFRVAAKKGAPVLVSVRLPYATSPDR